MKDIEHAYERQRSMIAVGAICCMIATLSIMPQNLNELWAMSMWEGAGFLAGLTGSIVLSIELAREHSS